MRKDVNYVGKRFGRLLAIEKIRNGKSFKYKCKCDCGNETSPSYSNLHTGTTKSCGCLKKEVISKAKRLSNEQVVSNQIWRIYRRNAKTRGYDWLLEKEDFLKIITSPCYYCGIEAGNISKARWGKDRIAKFNGIDRLDNFTGYIKKNCVACCRVCNCAKGELPIDEFYRWSKRLFDNLNNK